MLKRLDWLDVHGEQGGDSSTSDSPSDSSSDQQSSSSDQEASSDPGSPHIAARPSTKAAGRVALPASKAAAATGKAASAAAASAAAAAAQATELGTGEHSPQQRKKLKLTAENGTAARLDGSRDSQTSSEQDTSSDSEQQLQQKRKQKVQHQQQQHKQQPQKVGKQQLQQPGKGRRLHQEASSDSDIGSEDEDIAEYKREMMLGRDLSSSDVDHGGVNDESGSDVEGDEPLSGSEGQQELQVQEVERNWAEAELSETVRGVALRCVPCRALLLNAQTYRTHLHSKKHLSAMKKWDDGGDGHFIAFATDAPGKQAAADEGETHAERLQRLKQQIAEENAGLAGQHKQDNNKRKSSQTQNSKQHKRKGRDGKGKVEQAAAADVDGAEAPSKKHSKLGKRQRAAAKASTGTAGGGVKKGKIDKHHNAAAQRRKERRAAVAAAAGK